MSTASTLVAPKVAVVSSGSSVVFNNGGLRVNMVASRRSVMPSLAIRAYGAPAGEPGTGKDERVMSCCELLRAFMVEERFACISVGRSFVKVLGVSWSHVFGFIAMCRMWVIRSRMP